MSSSTRVRPTAVSATEAAKRYSIPKPAAVLPVTKLASNKPTVMTVLHEMTLLDASGYGEDEAIGKVKVSDLRHMVTAVGLWAGTIAASGSDEAARKEASEKMAEHQKRLVKYQSSAYSFASWLDLLIDEELEEEIMSKPYTVLFSTTYPFSVGGADVPQPEYKWKPMFTLEKKHWAGYKVVEDADDPDTKTVEIIDPTEFCDAYPVAVLLNGLPAPDETFKKSWHGVGILNVQGVLSAWDWLAAIWRTDYEEDSVRRGWIPTMYFNREDRSFSIHVIRSRLDMSTYGKHVHKKH